MRTASLSGGLTMAGETIAIRHRVTGAALFEAEIPAAWSHEPPSVKLGVAATLALEAKADLHGADLRGVDLGEADFRLANLCGADLCGADFCGAYLSAADLRLANLRGAHLSWADLRRADLSGACLHDADLLMANLSGADLHGVDLSRIDLSEANLSGAKGIIIAGEPNGWLAFGYREKDTEMLRVRVGCHDKTMDEARKYWSASHPQWNERQEIPAALDLIEAEAKSQGWST